MKRFRALLLLFLIFQVSPAFVSSQEAASADGGIFAPFVSRLSADIRSNMVRLSWQDSPNIRGPVYIYRSAAPIDSANLPSQSRPVTVPYGAESYIDELEGSGGTWYYFVAASDAAGQRYEIIIPSVNTTNVVLKSEELPLDLFPLLSPNSKTAATTTTSLWTMPSTSKVFSLNAVRREDGVLISYSTEEAKKAILYRSVKPIRQREDLLEAMVIQSGILSPFTDYPVSGIPYYYAVILEDDLVSGNIGIFPGQNATTTAVEIPPGEYRTGLRDSSPELRPTPLPRITPYSASSNMTYPETATQTASPLSAGAAEAVADLKAAAAPRPAKPPQAFSQDLEAPAGGEEYSLRTIIQGSFLSRNWETAREDLLQFLALPRTAATEARARIYLGQTYYFALRPQEALFEFLMAQSYYPTEASEWIQATLAILVKP